MCVTSPSLLAVASRAFQNPGKVWATKAGNMCDAAWCPPCSLLERPCGGLVYLGRNNKMFTLFAVVVVVVVV